MSFTEHWRLRLKELLTHCEMSQAAFADLIDVPPDYLSRLLYEPGKAGRKNLGLVTIRKISAALNLEAGWFDLPLGAALPSTALLDSHRVTEPALDSDRNDLKSSRATITPEPIVWPFRIVSYQRIARLRQHFSIRNMPTAIEDIDKHLDVLVTRWENEMNVKKSSAA